MHHYVEFGVETLMHIRRAAPKARIVVTLHEYQAICNHYGQMIKKPNYALCAGSSPRDCCGCFPEKTEQDFFLRDLYVKRFFGLVDHFISPSRFLADRYVAWGLPAARVSVIENGLPPLRGGVPEQSAIRHEGELVLGFFGQVSRLKGMNVLIEAARLLAKDSVEGIRFEIYGDYSNQPPLFREEFEGQIAAAPPNLRYLGPYDNGLVQQLMMGVDAVLVPSIWWENSPLVIQEAFRARRPVICSDIGGMAEKVRNGVDGYHFRAGSAHALAALVRSLRQEPDRLRRLQAVMATPPTIRETTALTIDLYHRLFRDGGAIPREQGSV